MALPALRILMLLALIQLTALSAQACFGPKLFIGTEAGLTGEMRYHLVALYLHEKTGIDSIRVELGVDETAVAAIHAEKIDLGFSDIKGTEPPVLLALTDGRQLYSGKRPLEDLQFSTVPRALKKLQQRVNGADLSLIEAEIGRGILPATAVRNFMLQAGWI